MAIHDLVWLGTASVIGVGASLVVAYVPELLRAVRARSSRDRLADKRLP